MKKKQNNISSTLKLKNIKDKEKLKDRENSKN